MTVEHTKTVTTPPVGSSSSTSSSSGLALAGILSAGLRLTLSGNWLVGGELEGVFPNQHKLEGTIVPTPNGNVHDVWPGQWDFSDLFGAGGNIIFGRASEDGRGRSVWDKALRVAPLRLPQDAGLDRGSAPVPGMSIRRGQGGDSTLKPHNSQGES